jgi:hypothetical protein
MASAPAKPASVATAQQGAELARRVIWIGCTLALSFSFGSLAAYNLENYRPITNDEVELIAVGYKLATQGVLGSDLYAGFFGADRHFFITLPVQHFLQAVSFSVFGAGIAQARAVSVVAGITVVWSVGWLAYRWYGLVAAIVCELLLIAWPMNLIAAANGLSLMGVSRAARYDVLAVAACWLTVVLLDITLRHPRRPGAFLLGALCGIASLTQFMGTFVLPLVLLMWLWARAPRGKLWWIVAGAALAILPWVAFVALHFDDFAGQLTVYAGRGEFLRAGFYAENIAHEASRYEHTLHPKTLSTWLLILGLWPAIAYVAWRSHRFQKIGDRVVWSSIVLFAGLLLVFDHGKSSVYAIALLPSICLAVSRLITGVVSSAWRMQPLLALAPAVASAMLLVLVLREGQSAYELTREQARAVTSYASVGAEIAHTLPPGSRVLGPERWWWAVHDHPYLSLRGVWWQWLAGRDPVYVDGTPWTEADHIVVNDNVRDDVLLFPNAVQQRFWTFVSDCTARVAELDGPTYFGIQIYRVTRASGCASITL